MDLRRNEGDSAALLERHLEVLLELELMPVLKSFSVFRNDGRSEVHAQRVLRFCIVISGRGREGGSLLTEEVMLFDTFDKAVIVEVLNIDQVECGISVNNAEREGIDIEFGHLGHPIDFMLM